MNDRNAPSRVAIAFGETVARMHLRSGGDPTAEEVVRRWAALAWQSADDGHVCVPIGDASEAATLAASPVVAEARSLAASGADAAQEADAAPEAGAAPGTDAVPWARAAVLVVDSGCVYLPRLHRAERQLAASVVALDRDAPVAAPERTRACLDALFPDPDGTDPQRHAAAAALTRRLALLSGGPGTGKTTTLARLLVAYLRLRPGARACFAAPTGKAAARLAQSLAEQLPRLDPDASLRASLPSSGMTVHRLLGLGGDAPAAGVRRAPLAWDLVIVDEASMLDLELAAALAAAIPPDGRLVLAGDADQLASVEAGAVFAELCASGLGATARLERNYRQRDAQAIVALASALRHREGPASIARAMAPHARIPARPEEIAEAAFAGYLPALDALAAGAPAARVLAEFDRLRVLAALREGEWGVRGLNRAIGARVRRYLGAAPQAQWYRGRLVMVTRNQPDSGLFNGDVGVCTDAQTVCFAGPQGVRELPLLAMPPCEDAFAITVHKSQGSEFDAVEFVPAPAGHALNTRELVYTAVTRARRALRIWGEPDALAATAAVGVARDGRLRERIVDALAARERIRDAR